ncbi:MAG TPA: VOC family protein [Gillisia sp.]|nr:VOC family protein [Gillisia sp.]
MSGVTDMWINLPVNDLSRAERFFVQLGFELNPAYSSENSISLSLGAKGIIVMLFPEDVFKDFSGQEVLNTRTATEVLFSLSVTTREEVDEIADEVEKAGGTIYRPPMEKDGWMYGCGFTDLDGHRWNVLHMDFSKLSKKST